MWTICFYSYFNFTIGIQLNVMSTFVGARHSWNWPIRISYEAIKSIVSNHASALRKNIILPA